MLKSPPLFCKPSTRRFVFSKNSKPLGGTVSFRSLNLKKDLKAIHSWVNAPYAQDFWQLNGSFSMLWSLYQCVEGNAYGHSFVGLFTSPPKSEVPRRSAPRDDKQLICQFDVYSVCADELREHVDLEDHDCGFHLLMAPCEKPIPGLTVTIIKSFLEYYFSFSVAKRMYAEPDVRNLKSIALLEKCGFVRLKTVQMSYKEAYIYCLEGSSIR